MNQRSEIASGESLGLRFYLEYDYLTAEQLSRLLLATHRLYDALFWEPVPAMIGETHDSRRSLHVRDVRTGSSVSIELANAVGETVGGLDPTLAGIGGGLAVTALTARVLIHAFSSGHRALSAARKRNIEIAEQRLQLHKQRASVEIDAVQDRLALRSSATEAELSEAAQRLQLDKQRASVEIEVAREQLELRSSAAAAELRGFVHSVLRATTAADFARSVERDLPLVDTVGNALLEAWSVIQDENIRKAVVSGEVVKDGK